MLLVVDLLPQVMAIWAQWAIWDIHGTLRREPDRAAKRRMAVLVREDGMAVLVREERP